ncbi:MAG: cation:proton antiporter [Leptolyngbya foveolarum]|uniref:Cation:proton antiporter n=1 Tax=Leptolyngbya foveolarum TaxID=47253 RepID=A0A2W4W0C8_9CYAN|nr:MAG: cation:proton antiporter [Leptolyngbya foveolarum]
MTLITLLWIALPLFLGFSIALFPQGDRPFTLMIAISSAAYGLTHILIPETTTLILTDHFGVTLMIDSLSGYFILTNALVTAAVVLYCWKDHLTQGSTAFFYTQLAILHGSINAVFVCADFISLYVALEVISIASFLLIAYPRTDKSIWVALRYLLISNTAMLFYLIGTALVYQASHSFAFEGLRQAPVEAIALIFLGLLAKGGIFISGLWLPLTHAESKTPVSAILSGIVIKTGVFPLVRCALLIEELTPVIQIFSVGTVLLGTAGAILKKDTKRTLAFSSISQMGFVLAAPAIAGVYALSHGLAKATLFLIAGSLPSRDFSELQKMRISKSLWVAITIASLSLCGFPLLAGFNAKSLVLADLPIWLSTALTIGSVGSAIAFAKFIFLPSDRASKSDTSSSSNLWPAVILLLVSLLLLGITNLESYTVKNIAKALITIAAGWLIYGLALRKNKQQFPQSLEKIEHLIGGMSIVLILLFWTVLQWQPSST